MQKFILFFILSLLFVAFGAFLFNSYVLQKSYFNSKNVGSPEPLINDVRPRPTQSIYVDYSKEIYDKTLGSKRVLVLYFTSNWCNVCIQQDANNKEIFNKLSIDEVVGLKIHILDSETTTETDALAKKFDVVKENTFVILDKNGAIAFKYVGEMSSDMIKNKILDIVK